MNELSSAERRTLRALAHSLNPVVIIGNSGLTPAVVAEIERSLKAHELIKIRIGGMDHDERDSACKEICERTSAAPVQHIGKILVIYRKNPAEQTQKAPEKARVKPGSTATRPARRPSGRTAPADRAANYSGTRRRPTTRG